MRMRAAWALLIAIVALGAALRLTGITWGVPTAASPHVPFHPDEPWAMQVLGQIDPGRGDLDPEEAHREGTLSYHLWYATAAALRAAGVVDKLPHELRGFDRDYARILIAGRIVTVLFGLGTIVIVFLAARRMAARPLAAVLAALLIAVTPFEVVYAHYLRPHVIADFFVALAIYAATFLAASRRPIPHLLVGLACGLATAARYNVVLVALVPIAVVGWRELVARRGDAPLRRRLLTFTGASFLVGAGVPIGLFAGDPHLFLAWREVKPQVMLQASYMAADQLRGVGILSLGRIGVYLEWLIPYGTLPLLWVLYYAAVPYALARRELRRFAVPLVLYLVVYLFVMAKGYYLPLFIRAALPMFPAFALVAALAVDDLVARLRAARRVVATAAVALVVGASLFYDCAYVRGMSADDPRTQLAAYLSGPGVPRDVRLGVLPSDWDYFLIRPTLDVLPDRHVSYVVRSDFAAGPALDYVLLFAFIPENYPAARATIQHLEKSGKYALAATFATPLRLAGIELGFRRNPHDLVYPFPTLYLLRRR
jgi:dolichyl-phosphate-mannose-protein mannosyltransferase